MTITAIILTKNNSKSIERQIKNLDFADEIVLIDDNSTDRTLELAQNFGAKVFKRVLNNDFAAQRNFGLQKSSSDWVLFVDSDEMITKELKGEIVRAILDTHYDGFFIKRQDHWLGKTLTHGEFGNTKLVRLGRRKAGIWTRQVHETWNISNTGNLQSILTHTPHPSISEFLSEINFYSSLHAQVNSRTKKSSFFKIISYPTSKFFVNFVIKQGFRDGVHGFVAAVLMSFHSYLAWSKQWTKEY